MTLWYAWFAYGAYSAHSDSKLPFIMLLTLLAMIGGFGVTLAVRAFLDKSIKVTAGLKWRLLAVSLIVMGFALTSLYSSPGK